MAHSLRHIIYAALIRSRFGVWALDAARATVEFGRTLTSNRAFR
jgi:hypothetical protein